MRSALDNPQQMRNAKLAAGSYYSHFLTLTLESVH